MSKVNGRVEEDLSSRSKSMLAGWLALCLVAVCSLTFGLTVWFRFALDAQRNHKVQVGPAGELSRYHRHVQQVLSGQKGLVEGSTPIAVDKAMERFVQLHQDSAQH